MFTLGMFKIMFFSYRHSEYCMNRHRRLDFASPATKHDFWLKGGREAVMIWCSKVGLVASKYVIDKENHKYLNRA